MGGLEVNLVRCGRHGLNGSETLYMSTRTTTPTLRVLAHAEVPALIREYTARHIGRTRLCLLDGWCYSAFRDVSWVTTDITGAFDGTASSDCRFPGDLVITPSAVHAEAAVMSGYDVVLVEEPAGGTDSIYYSSRSKSTSIR